MNIPHKIKQLENKLGRGFNVYYETFGNIFRIQYYSCKYDMFSEITITTNEFLLMDIEDNKTVNLIKNRIKSILIEFISNELNKELKL